MEAVCLRYAVMTDFGSTYTKVVCADLEDHKTVLTDKFPSTVHTDAMIGLHQCYDAVAKVIGQDELDAAFKLSTSSAAGGLRMAVSGLTKSLSNAAGKNACCSAGGKLVYAASGMLKPEDIQAMDDNNAEIILLCGGYEHGNFASVLENAKTLSDSQIRTPVIYAGNSEVAQEVSIGGGFGIKYVEEDEVKLPSADTLAARIPPLGFVDDTDTAVIPPPVPLALLGVTVVAVALAV